MKTTFRSHLNYSFAALLFCALLLTATRALADLQMHSIDGKILGIRFDQFMGTPSAVAISNYTVYGKASGTMTVTNAVLQDDDRTIALYLTASAGEFFVVGVSNVVSSSGTNYNTTTTGYLNYFGSASLGSATNPAPVGEAISFFRDTFYLRASGSDLGGTNDHGHFVYQTVVSNFDMSVQVTRLDNTDPAAKAGLMVRENNDAGCREIGIYFTPLNGGSNLITSVYRSATNAVAGTLNQPILSHSLSWLRMTRSNNVFNVYYGSNGASWTSFASATLAWNTSMNVGAAATSHTNGILTTAGFSSLTTEAARPGDGLVPTLSVTVVSNNLVAKWQRTPRDFAVQVIDNLGSAPNTGGATNPPPAWAFLLQPIYDTSLTGTNVYMPTAGRYMTIPLDLFNNNEMYVRLVQVERVFPDPVDVKGGICLSGKNFSTNAGGGTLCSDTVDAPRTVTLTNSTYVICMKTNIYEFTTENSDASAHTVMQLRNRISGLSNYLAACVGSTNATYIANNYKAAVTLPMSLAVSNYTFIVGASPAGAKKTPIQVDIRLK
jgi:regulation of enolase protein 1 (concanavalin A-like superfamily)